MKPTAALFFNELQQAVNLITDLFGKLLAVPIAAYLPDSNYN